jgi:hypothetical protein
MPDKRRCCRPAAVRQRLGAGDPTAQDWLAERELAFWAPLTPAGVRPPRPPAGRLPAGEPSAEGLAAVRRVNAGLNPYAVPTAEELAAGRSVPPPPPAGAAPPGLAPQGAAGTPPPAPAAG